MTSVLIVGAGPTGLTLALDLARRGVLFRLVDAAPSAFTGSRGKGLQPRSLEVFEDLGVLDALLVHGGPYPSMRTYQDNGVVSDRALGEHIEPTPAVPHPNPLMVPQWRTETLLREHLADLGGTVEFGTRLTGFTQDADGVTATLASPYGNETVRADYLVGADGGRSTVRKTLDVSFLGETYDTQRMLVGDVRLTGLDRDFWHMWPAPGMLGGLALCPLAGTDTFQLITPPLSEGTDLPSLAELQDLLTSVTARPEIVLTELLWLSLYRANVRMVDRYRVGRVFLAGDAAHVHPPSGGQGLNTGVQDAYNLGWKLAAVLDGAPETLLDTYEQERLPVAAHVLGLSTHLLARDAAEGIRRDEETRQLGLGYRGGPLAGDPRETTTGLAAGDRAPDALLPGGRRLFDLCRGPHATALVFGSDARVRELDVTAVLTHGGLTGVPVRVVAVPEESARASYGVPEGAVVLVRPDGYLASVDAAPAVLHGAGW